METGPWRVVRQLSSGGLCGVFEVERTRGERAALKRYTGLNLLDEETRRRFSREIRLGLTVAHPNVCRAIDWGMAADGAPYLVMELLTGSTLRTLMDETGRIPAPRALALMRQLLEGIEAIHRAGLIHRDLKPENIFVTQEGDIRILDFGLTSKFASGSLTPSGISLGTVPYTAPEQVFNARHVDARADLFTAGVVLYEMLTAQRPFSGTSMAETLSLLTSGDIPRVSAILPEWADTPLDDYAHHLMARTPEERPASATAALAELP